MNVLILGGAGFIGTNLILKLRENSDLRIFAYDRKCEYFPRIIFGDKNITLIEGGFDSSTDYDALLNGMDYVFHLESTSSPTTSNINIAGDIISNVIPTTKMLDACIRKKVKRVIFLSSGGAVYGKEAVCPIDEETPLKPITSYGIQKMSIERLLYLYEYLYGLEYRVIRLSNPYGPYQRPNGKLGAITTFIYDFINSQRISVFGDGSVIRDFIYIDDAIEAILKVVFDKRARYNTYNVGAGEGTSISDIILCIQKELRLETEIEYLNARSVDVPENILNIKRYESDFGMLITRPLNQGIRETYEFFVH